MKLVVICQVIDLKYGLGTTPAWWQLLKALHRLDTEVIVVPYLGDPVQAPWWRTYPNPCARESILYNQLFERKALRTSGGRGIASRLARLAIQNYVNPKWKNHLMRLLDIEGDVDAVLFLSVPLNHFSGIASVIKKTCALPVVYYDGDMPTILPGYAEERGFRFSYYLDADLSEYDAFLTNSKGVEDLLRQMGANNVGTLYYGIDPELYAPVEGIVQDIDVFYYGHGSRTREDRLGFMISEPSRALPGVTFLVAGRSFDIDMGDAKVYGDLSLPSWRRFCCRSKINLNITRAIHASIYGSSTARLFELASLGCCIVSDPYAGLNEWFEEGREVFIARSAEEARDTYRWLLASPEVRARSGGCARERVMNEHTYLHRARQLLHVLGAPQTKMT